MEYLPASSSHPDAYRPATLAHAAPDKRLAPRRSFVLYIARVEQEDSRDLCRVQNLSGTGMMAEFTRPGTVGARLRIVLPDSGATSGKVVWTKGLYAGLSFASPIDTAGFASRQVASPADLMLQHEYLGVLGSALAALIAGPRAADDLDSYALRQRFSQALRAHLKQEDWAVYPELVRDPDPAVVEIAKRFQGEMGGLHLSLDAYSQRWSSTAIASDWSGFRRDTETLLRALRRRAEREDSELYPLLLAKQRSSPHST